MAAASHVTLSKLPEPVSLELTGLFDDLVKLPRVQRLQRVSFLGAIERFALSKHSARRASAGSRYDHSVGVARLLCQLTASGLPLSGGESRIALAHALLHDVGHGPFSHSSEPFFRATFSLDHHQKLRALVEDREGEISKVLSRHGLWRDYLRFVRQPNAHPKVFSLFYGPINLDTIDGILRAARFFHMQVPVEAVDIVNALSRRCIAVKPLDAFWQLKSRVYNECIFNEYAHADEKLTSILLRIAGQIRETDFDLDDDEFERKFELAFQKEEFAEEATVSCQRFRRFTIRSGATPSRIGTLGARYVAGEHIEKSSHTELS